MKTHTQDFKDQIKEMGRELDSKITYILNNETIELGAEELNSITPHYQGAILKSVMKQLDIDSNEDIPLGTEINYQFGVKVNNSYEYLDYGNYIVYSSEKQEDTRSYKIIAYDKMLYSMVDYVSVGVTYPCTIRDYISAICTHLNLTFKNASDTFVNYDKTLANELYLDENGNSLGYTFRDVLDELAQVTASTICLDKNDQLEIRYIQSSGGQPQELFDYDYQVENQYNSSGTIQTNERYVLNNETITIVRDKSNYGRYFMNKLELPSDTYYLSFTPTLSGNTKEVSFSIKDLDNQVTYEDENITITDGVETTLEFTLSQTTTIAIELQPRTSSSGTLSFTNVSLNNGEIIGNDDTIDEDYLKNINVNFGEKFGPINTISLKRSGDSDVISQSIPSNLSDDQKIEIAISDNQILNGNNRDEYLDGILNKLYGLEYYINDFSSTGICYLDLCDRYNVNVDNKIYSCIMFNDEVDITQGLEEKIHTNLPNESVTDYKKASSTDRKINQAYIIVDKVNTEITALTSETQTLSTQVTNNYNELLQSVQNLDNSVTQLDTRTTQVEQNQTDTYTKTEIREIITGTNTDGVTVTSLKSTSATFDEDGMHYEKTGAETSSTINESGLEVDDNSGTELLFAGYDREMLQALVRVANLYLTRYLGFENWRLEEVEDNDYGIGLGFFYTGGE